MVNDVQVLALDIDGVLTDGTACETDHRGETKRYSFQDLDAVAQARRAGLTVVLVTGEDNSSVSAIARRFGVEQVVRGAKDKLLALSTLSDRLEISLDRFCYLGDGDRDAPALREVGLGLAPSNATPAAKAAAHRVLSRSGGAGAVAEAVSLLSELRMNGEQSAAMELEMQRIVADSLAAHQRMLDQSLPVLVQVAKTFIRAIRAGRKILFFGNGGSAAEAQHVAGELIGRFAQDSNPWPAIALTTDTSVVTAIANDWSYSEVFSRQVRGLARSGDVVVGISTSGRSANVLNGLEAGRQCGAVTIGFTGSNPGRLLELSDICFAAPASTASRIQELSLLAWHTVCELVERELVAGQRFE
jgi:D-sedoheptulose 7-phosphate isomerase